MRDPRTVPLADLQAQHQPIHEDLTAAFERVLRSAHFVLGAEGETLEREFAAWVGAPHAVGVSNGTDALHLALRVLGVGPGDEVIVPSMSFVATASAVRMAGAQPVFADIEPDTFHLAPLSVAARITGRTRCVIPVHLYGQEVLWEPLRELARRHGLRIVEDACQAHGAGSPGPRAGTRGDIGCFSFYPSKNLGALGDAGMLVTADAELAERARWLRNHGQTDKNLHAYYGFNFRLDELQAALLRVKLPHLDAWNTARRERAERYHEALDSLPLGLPRAAAGRDHVYHLYVVRTAAGDRDRLLSHLHKHGIGASVHYPTPIHRQPAFADVPSDSTQLAESEAAAREVLSLPLYPELTDAEQDRVVATVRDYYGA